MTTRKSTDETEQAAVRPREYAAGTGWDVGQSAPDDAYRALDPDGTGAPVGPVVHTHPGGYAVQIVAKGALVTESVARALAAADDPSTES
ncbi:hypothetical protein GCM10009759_55200 [Kitasatospora saccharophila]|uniref:Uncharacterized protein n=1 Tax=Kitasatospora saccharophila TaxID=407973 RepID=A0ABN2XJ10_9ACTN